MWYITTDIRTTYRKIVPCSQWYIICTAHTSAVPESCWRSRQGTILCAKFSAHRKDVGWESLCRGLQVQPWWRYNGWRSRRAILLMLRQRICRWYTKINGTGTKSNIPPSSQTNNHQVGEQYSNTRSQHLKSMLVKWHPNKRLQKLWRQLKDTANYAVYASQHIPNNQVVDATLNCIDHTQVCRQSFLDLNRELDQRYMALQIFLRMPTTTAVKSRIRWECMATAWVPKKHMPTMMLQDTPKKASLTWKQQCRQTSWPTKMAIRPTGNPHRWQLQCNICELTWWQCNYRLQWWLLLGLCVSNLCKCL